VFARLPVPALLLAILTMVRYESVHTPFIRLLIHSVIIDEGDDIEVQEFEYEDGRKVYDDLIVIKVHDETVNNLHVNNFAVVKPGMTYDDIPHMSGRIVDMEDGSTVAEFTYPANRAAFFEEEDKWKTSLAKMTTSKHAQKLLISFDEMMTYFESQPVVLKTVRIDFGTELTNQFLSAGLPNGMLDRMSIPFVYQKRIQTKKEPPEFKTYKISEMNVVWRPVIAGSDRPIKGAKNKSSKEDQDVENLNWMLSTMM
jgi:hypothetical protein